MRRVACIMALVAALLLLPLGTARAEDRGCRACHGEMASPMPPPGQGQPTDCTACHLGNGAADQAQDGHAGLAANPSALDQAARACGPCHPGRAEQVEKSPMATAMGVINQTRFLWGSQPDAKPRYAIKAVGGLAAIPLPTPATPGGRPAAPALPALPSLGAGRGYGRGAALGRVCRLPPAGPNRAGGATRPPAHTAGAGEPVPHLPRRLRGRGGIRWPRAPR